MWDLPDLRITVGVGQHNAFCALKYDGFSRFTDGRFCFVQAVEISGVWKAPTRFTVLAVLSPFIQRHIFRRWKLV